MTTIRTVIVDDEDLARERLVGLLKPFADVEIVGTAGNGEEAIDLITKLKPDLVFLDIQMPGCSGIEVAASLPAEKPRVIFCTAYDRYAIEAFEVHAVDYLLKPVNRVRLARSLERVREGHSPGDVGQALRSQPPTRFLAKKGNQYRVIPQDEVRFFLSDGGLTQLWTADAYYWMEPTLAELENRLERAGFFRVSRQALVNLDHLESVIPLIGGHGQVRLKNGRVLDVSRRRMKPLMDTLQEESR